MSGTREGTGEEGRDEVARREGHCFARKDGQHCDQDGQDTTKGPRCCGCGYRTEEDSMTFGNAIEELKAGKKVSREGWNGKGMWLALQVPDAGSKMSLPYIYMSTVTGALVPWLASQTDVLAEDWGIVAPA